MSINLSDNMLSAALNFPNLAPKEELELWNQYFDENSTERVKEAAKNRLVTSHLKLVVKHAGEAKKNRISLRELFSQGQIGLMQAFHKFELDKGARFGTYASWWIKASIKQYVRNNIAAIKMGSTPFEKFLFSNYYKEIEALRSESPHLPLRGLQRKICKEYFLHQDKYNEDKALALLDGFLARMASKDLSLNAPVSNGDAEGSSEMIDFLVSDALRPDQIVEKQDQTDRLRTLWSKFTSADEGQDKNRRHRIFQERRFRDPEDMMTLDELAEEFGISRERVRQIDEQVFKQFQKFVRSNFRGSNLLSVESQSLPAPIMPVVKPAFPQLLEEKPDQISRITSDNKPLKKAGVPERKSAVSSDVLPKSIGKEYIRKPEIEHVFSRNNILRELEIGALKDKFYLLASANKKKKERDWGLYESIRIKNEISVGNAALEVNITSPAVSMALKRVANILGKNPSHRRKDFNPEFIEKARKLFLLNGYFREHRIAKRNWDIFHSLNIAKVSSTQKEIADIHNIFHSVVSVTKEKMTAIMEEVFNEVQKKNPELSMYKDKAVLAFEHTHLKPQTLQDDKLEGLYQRFIGQEVDREASAIEAWDIYVRKRVQTTPDSNNLISQVYGYSDDQIVQLENYVAVKLDSWVVSDKPELFSKSLNL